MGTFYNPRLVTDGLVLCLDAGNKRSYPGAGTTWYDLSGNNNHFSLNGTIFNAYNASSYFIFGDNEGDYTYRSTTDVIGGMTDITIDMWILITILQDQIAFLSYATVSSISGNELLIFKSGGTIIIYWSENGAESNTSQVFDTSFYNIGKWINFVFKRNSSASNIYINGIERASLGGAGADILGNGGTLVFGQEQDSVLGGFSNAQDFPGYLNSLKIYNRALSAQEIKQNYNATKGRFGL